MARNLEPNLYEYNGYFKYRHPITKKFTGFGKDKKKAMAAARKLNAQLMVATEAETRVKKVNAEGVPTFSELLRRYREERLAKKRLAAETLKLTNYRMDRLNKELGEFNLNDFSVKMIADYLDANFKNDPYVKHRMDLIDIFRWGRTKGIVEQNYAADTLAIVKDPKARLPMSIEWYVAIRNQAEDWLQVAMDLALITLQRRGDLVELKYTDIYDNCIHVIQNKTQKHGTAANIRMMIHDSLAQVIERSKRIPPFNSEYVIHRTPIQKRHSAIKSEFSQLTPDRLSKEFAKARDKVPEIARLPVRQRPGLHEIRSLGSFLYTQLPGHNETTVKRMKGELGDDVDLTVQQRLGHTKASMSRHYVERHIEWTDVDGDLVLPYDPNGNLEI